MAGKTNEIRCSNCNKMLGEGSMNDGEISIKCGKCGTLNTIKAQPKQQSYQDRLDIKKKDYNYKEEKEQFVIKRIT